MVQLTLICQWYFQTHSAYMLFYKRVELEEENGKDFSFDVSPDLLEVPWVFFLTVNIVDIQFLHVSVSYLSVDLA